MSRVCDRGVARRVVVYIIGKTRESATRAISLVDSSGEFSVFSRPPSEMVVFRTLCSVILALAFVAVRAHIASHDNILRIQLWDAEGLTKDPAPTIPVVTTKTTARPIIHKHSVDLNSLYKAMLDESYDRSEFGRFTRHKVRHKRRRPRQSGADLPWKFHDGEESLNVGVYDAEVPWNVIEAVGYPSGTEISAVQSVSSASFPVNKERDVGLPMTLRQDEEMEVEVMSALGVQTLSIDIPDNVPSFSVIVAPRWLIVIQATDSLPVLPREFYSQDPFQNSSKRRCVDKNEYLLLFFFYSRPLSVNSRTVAP